MESLRQILLVEENPHDVQSTLTVLSDYNLANQIDVVHNRAEAVEYLQKKGPFSLRPNGIPAIILFDLNSLSGEAPGTLAALTADERLKGVPLVVLVSTREERATVEKAGLQNATYMVKPMDIHELIEAMKSIGGAWAFVLRPFQESAGDRGGVMRRFHLESQPRRMTELSHGSPDSNTPSRG